MTEWKCDLPPSATTSMIAGCFTAGVSVCGDFSECDNECEPPPNVTVIVPDGVSVTVYTQPGGF